MENLSNPLDSAYIIDGQKNEVTPAQMLHEAMMWRCGRSADNIPEKTGPDIIDESLDIPPSNLCYHENLTAEYIERCTAKAVSMQDRPFETLQAEYFSKTRVAGALIDSLWIDGAFKLEDLSIWIDWKWNCAKVGNMAAFYKSVQATSDYLYDLGIPLSGYLFEKTESDSVMACFPMLGDNDEDNSEIDEDRDIWMGEDRICSAHFAKVKDSALLFIPFDSCDLRVGASILAECLHESGGLAPNISDPDYFMDCYEVVREFCEDGLIIAGRTVCDGGIAVATRKMCTESLGAEISMKGISKAYNGAGNARTLFSEVPGVLIQVHEKDIEYIDTQMLLQDVAYYRIGTVRSLQSTNVPNGDNGEPSDATNGDTDKEDTVRKQISPVSLRDNCSMNEDVTLTADTNPFEEEED